MKWLRFGIRLLMGMVLECSSCSMLVFLCDNCEFLLVVVVSVVGIDVMCLW